MIVNSSGVRRREGFTIVELLIVIVVIAILAAITLVAYNGIQNRSIETSVKSDISNFKKRLELLRVDTSDGNYPTTLTANMGFTFTKTAYRADRYNLYYCPSADRTQYAFGVMAKTGKAYIITSQGGNVEPTNLTNGAVCAYVGLSGGAQTGYGWDGTSGSWVAWTN